MSPAQPENIGWLMYNEFQLMRYIRTVPLWRRIFARFSEKYKITKEEYDKWWWKNLS